MSAERLPGYDAVIPARVLYDKELTDKAKLLYGVIRNLALREGFCWAEDKKLAFYFGVSTSCISENLRKLEGQRHIFREVIRDEETKQVLERRIWVDRMKFFNRDPDLPPPDFQGTPPPDFQGTPPPDFQGTPPSDFRGEKINKLEEDIGEAPLKSPHGGQAPAAKPKRRGKPPRKAPDWKPDRFAGFWAYYPRSENKQKSMDAWDRLKPSDELIDRMAEALKKLKATRDWQEGIGIPHASTWLNNARWEDADGLPEQGTSTHAGGWADDPEVM